MKTTKLRILLVGALAMLASIAAGADSSDQDAVAALDAEYQAAVKINDADTMNRILADDFVVVTGSGKIYTKADLLDMAPNEASLGMSIRKMPIKPCGCGAILRL